MKRSCSSLVLLFAALLPAMAGDATNHWAYQPVVRPAVPGVANATGNPVDAFVRAKLADRGLAPAPEADRRSLVRRVFLDLTGLPPTPEEAAAFEADDASDAYGRLVDRLLASPRHGERWARHWMDAAHFAETHGHDQDRIRTHAWPYRDYLVASFNADKPYDRFVREQVAGDALFPDDPTATVALGFLASGPWDESSLRDIREDTLDRQIGRYLDRDDVVTTVMQTFASVTVQCARCHDHKFDPIPQRDYYALQAVFAGVDRANRVWDADPAVHRARQELFALRRKVARGDPAVLLSAAARAEVADWVRAGNVHPVAWSAGEPQQFLSTEGATLSRRPDGSVFSGGKRPDRETTTISAKPPLEAITAVRLEVMADDALPQHGPGRNENGNFHLSEFQLLLFEPGAERARVVELANPSADFEQDGWGIARALDGDEKTAWGIHPREGESHEAVFELKQTLRPAPGSTLVFVLRQLHGGGHVIGRARVSVTDAGLPVRVLPAAIREAIAVSAERRTDAQWTTLSRHVVGARIGRGLAALPSPSMVYAAASDFEPDGGLKPAAAPRTVNVLRRGEITKPGAVAEPGTLSCVAALRPRFEVGPAQEEGARRAALASWLADRDNPLVWRSIVNRVWRLHFGHGLVDTPNDFGKMGDAPSHPELLDWLAAWFRDDAKGSLKQLHRLIVTSATYRQRCASADPRAAATMDPDNRLLSRMNRTRLDAEQVRDTILQASGRLDLRMGGPGDRQFDLQPGIHVTPRVDYTKFDIDADAGRRRGIYRFLFRTLPDPFMDALDCPAGDQLTPIRTTSVTVQQALALWNDVFVTRHAEHLARRIEAEANGIEARVARAFELVLQRRPSPAESGEFVAYANRHGLANGCRLLLNANEFMFVN
ncbi:MAG: DUF1549 domain-containing protein [Verrucomicrobia bacterium]|nr:MAG: DUF1549 domain-containing protein [Verrucomicrobiota bacterium]